MVRQVVLKFSTGNPMNLTTKFFATLVSAAAMVLTPFATAAITPYDKAQFDKLIAEGKPVVVDFFADWCSTCRAQKPIVRELAAEPAMKDVTIFVATFDKEKELRKTLRVRSQSTFVVFKSGKEIARSTGQLVKEEIGAMFAKAL
jgi:thioredoxin 1